MEKYARKCDCCGSGMNVGFLDAGATYCSTRCLVWGNSTENTTDFESFVPLTEQVWTKHCKENDDQCMYTEWYETIDEEDEWFDENGTPYGKCHKCKEDTKMVDFCEHCHTCIT